MICAGCLYRWQGDPPDAKLRLVTATYGNEIDGSPRQIEWTLFDPATGSIGKPRGPTLTNKAWRTAELVLDIVGVLGTSPVMNRTGGGND